MANWERSKHSGEVGFAAHLPSQRRDNTEHHPPDAHEPQRAHVQPEMPIQPRTLILAREEAEGRQAEGGCCGHGLEEPAEGHGECVGAGRAGGEVEMRVRKKSQELELESGRSRSIENGRKRR